MWVDSSKICFQLCLLLLSTDLARCQQGEGAFVEKLAEELKQLGTLVTKYSEITNKYRMNNARVDTNDGRNLTGQIIENVGRMMERRTQAVKCIQKSAESLIAESKLSEFNEDEDFNLEYFNMQYSGVSFDQLPWSVDINTTNYIDINLTSDRHFYSIPVNTENSAVHIPTNLYDRYPQVAEAINWSAGLNETFVRNYRSDPEMGWQYFGASTGMMRQYPAMKWKTDNTIAEMYDCRTRPWFIEAATCAKDVVILMDNSGSMTGMRNTIAKLVVNKLLTTFSNNDFINVLNFSWTATPVVPCFKTLVQANVQNIKHLQAAVGEVKPQGNASVPNAFEAAFHLLQEAREQRNCDNSSQCQQAIMLITDGLPGNISEVFLKYNRLHDGVPPVRVFTFLLGLEVRGVNEMQDIACENRGYYVHITALDQVQDQVLKYIAVMARPLALQMEEHPPRWTHLFADVDDPKMSQWLDQVMNEVPQQARLAEHRLNVKSQYFSQQREDWQYVVQVDQVEGEEQQTTYKEYRMMTSVAIPVYDNRELSSNQSKFPEFLAGVAGTDIPIKDIYKLTYPYKIGANGYAFIITNNGHILMHPDHRPVSKGFMKENYNSIDLLDVEFAADSEGEKMIQELRDEMVSYLEGDRQNVMVKFHYDDMHRVGVEKRDYYYSPLPGTPFSLGLAIPSDYGDYQIGIKDVVNERFLTYTSYNTEGYPLDEYFKEPNWRIHPDWTYCKYRFASHKPFNSSEEELVDILRKLRNQLDWREYQKKWKAESQNLREDSDRCNEPFVPEDSFYCDPDLITLLILDAMVTLQPFQEPVQPKNSYEVKIMKTYNATVRFVATQSGFTRWKKVSPPATDAKDDGDNFGQHFPYAIHEPWFKAAVLQYNLDTKGEYNQDGDSFVFSVPFDSGHRDDLSLMAAIAIFPRDGGRKAPASVVGYQMTYDSFFDRCVELFETNQVDCKSGSRACYIIDHNAYVILSFDRQNVGRPLRNVQAEALHKLISIGLYRAINITDHQALVVETTWVPAGGGAGFLQTPWFLVIRALSWVWTQLFYSIFHQLGIAANPIENDDSEEIEESEEVDYTDQKHATTFKVKSPEQENISNTLHQTAEPAVQHHTFYLLEENAQQWFIRNDSDPSVVISARRIEHTNMMLVVVDLLKIDSSMQGKNSTDPEQLDASVCARYSRYKDLRRRGLANCTAYHIREEEFDACGNSSTYFLSYFLLILTLTQSLFKFIGIT